MTTIAATHTTMCADGKVTDGSLSYTSSKMRILADGRVVGTAGNSRLGELFVAVLEGKDKTSDSEVFNGDDCSFEALVLEPGGRLRHYCQSFRYSNEILDPYYAIGSGAQCALLLMRLFGFGPDEAIYGVIEAGVDSYTGHPVFTAEVKA